MGRPAAQHLAVGRALGLRSSSADAPLYSQPRHRNATHARGGAARAEELGLAALHLELRGGMGLEGFYERLGWQIIGRWPDALRFAPDDRPRSLTRTASSPCRSRRSSATSLANISSMRNPVTQAGRVAVQRQSGSAGSLPRCVRDDLPHVRATRERRSPVVVRTSVDDAGVFERVGTLVDQPLEEGRDRQGLAVGQR